MLEADLPKPECTVVIVHVRDPLPPVELAAENLITGGQARFSEFFGYPIGADDVVVMVAIQQDASGPWYTGPQAHKHLCRLIELGCKWDLVLLRPAACGLPFEEIPQMDQYFWLPSDEDPLDFSKGPPVCPRGVSIPDSSPDGPIRRD